MYVNETISSSSTTSYLGRRLHHNGAYPKKKPPDDSIYAMPIHVIHLVWYGLRASRGITGSMILQVLRIVPCYHERGGKFEEEKKEINVIWNTSVRSILDTSIRKLAGTIYLFRFALMSCSWQELVLWGGGKDVGELIKAHVHNRRDPPPTILWRVYSEARLPGVVKKKLDLVLSTSTRLPQVRSGDRPLTCAETLSPPRRCKNMFPKIKRPEHDDT